ncbi:MAG: HAD family hydrolase [Alkalibacterium sp.]|nr:HAD family hydrolase [Alkalibacterium sp.]
MVLDIDETLLHSTYEKLKVPADFTYKERNVYLRPHLTSFLDYCFTHFNVGIWTVALAEYADFVLRKMGRYDQLEFVYHRDHCQEKETFNGLTNEIRHLKDLHTLKTYKLESIIMLDDTPQFVRPLDNVLMIPEFRGEADDQALLDIQKKLENLI